ncbi:MAG TPA: hypothetical protein VFV64_15900 [Permianibacter sp.]|nr:hypothetical protein [Permianibacter sp.]
MTVRLFVFVALPLLAQSASAADSCAALSERAIAAWGEPANCYCGASLANVTVHLPGTLTVAAACKMYFDHGQDGRYELAPEKDRLNLDRYNDDGNFPGGMIFLSGQVELDGVVRYSQGMDEVVSFYAMQLVREDGGVSVLANSYLYRGIFFSSQQAEQLNAPKLGSDVACFQREATLRFTDFEIRITDTDESGAFPQVVEVVKLGPLTDCPS